MSVVSDSTVSVRLSGKAVPYLGYITISGSKPT